MLICLFIRPQTDFLSSDLSPSVSIGNKYPTKSSTKVTVMDGTTTFDARPMDKCQVHSAGRHLVDRSLNESPPEVVYSQENYLYLKSTEIVFDATCGAAVSCLGHGNQEVTKAITDQLSINAYSNSMLFTTAAATQLAEEIILGTDNLMSSVYICSSGITRLLGFHATS